MLCVRSLKALGVLTLSLAVCGIAQTPCTMTVSPWQSLQSVLDLAPSGSVVCLTTGVWTQGISIRDKILTLWGAGRDQTILVGTAGTDGISVSGQSIVTIKGLGIHNFRDGIVVNGYSHTAVHDTQISGNTRYGLHALGLGQATLENSVISYNRGGILTEDSAHVTAQYSQILNNQEDGIWLDFASWAWLAHNIVMGNGRYGIRLYSLEGLFVCWRNVVANNRAGDFYPEIAAQKCQ